MEIENKILNLRSRGSEFEITFELGLYYGLT
jgi:hypothetical protein